MVQINSEVSNVQISEEVIATIAHTAMLEVEGTCDCTTLAGDIFDKFLKKSFKGINLNIENNEVNVNINLAVKVNFKIDEVAKETQKKVKNAIETMTGLKVRFVNINIVGLETSKNTTK